MVSYGTLVIKPFVGLLYYSSQSCSSNTAVVNSIWRLQSGAVLASLVVVIVASKTQGCGNVAGTCACAYGILFINLCRKLPNGMTSEAFSLPLCVGLLNMILLVLGQFVSTLTRAVPCIFTWSSIYFNCASGC